MRASAMPGTWRILASNLRGRSRDSLLTLLPAIWTSIGAGEAETF